MNTGLAGRVALVAASSAGLGRAVAEGLAAEGAHLALCSRHADRIEATAREIRERFPIHVKAGAVNVTDPAAVEGFVAAVLSEFGRLDICVTNAGGPPSKTFATTTLDDWRQAIELNLLSHVIFAKQALPVMQRAGWGRFLMISSVSVKQPIEGLVLSNTARGAVPGLTRTLASEYGPYGVTVNNVCPGYTRTERLDELAKVQALGQGITPEAAMRRWSEQTALRRLAEPREFADAVVFLASERASYITGQNLVVDGGFYKGSL
ncbi:MAG TPA: SDR family oxidoreductase [Terriglobales bacterium]|nr:SDR family oxidoreductase [Terriglobales bacterium]